MDRRCETNAGNAAVVAGLTDGDWEGVSGETAHALREEAEA